MLFWLKFASNTPLTTQWNKSDNKSSYFQPCWIIGISKLNRNIFCFTVYEYWPARNRRLGTLGTCNCKWFCSILRVNVLCLVTSGVPNNNGPFYVNVNFFLSFLEWSKLRIITGDWRWFIWQRKFFISWLWNYLCWFIVSFVQ